jgi:hypothetical protein
MKTYVYDGTEVKLTGREAVRRFGKTAAVSKTFTLVEITPVDASFEWKKWVSPDQLYEVKEE